MSPCPQEYDIVSDPSMTPQQRLEKQRQQLKKRLGALGFALSLMNVPSENQHRDIWRHDGSHLAAQAWIAAWSL